MTVAARSAPRGVLPRRAAYRASLVRSPTTSWCAPWGGSSRRPCALTCEQGHLVADVGCGEQPWRNLVETLGARCYLGADVEQNTSGSVMLRCLADALPLADGTVDVVLCTEVLEHLPDPGRRPRGAAPGAPARRPGGGHDTLSLSAARGALGLSAPYPATSWSGAPASPRW